MGRYVQKLLSEAPGQYDDAALEAIRRATTGADQAHTAAIESVMGTTVATNALLERKGEPVVLITTAPEDGSGSATKPGPTSRSRYGASLYTRVLSAHERVDATGQILTPLGDIDTLRAQLETAHTDGFRACAIACMHSTLNSSHEQVLTELALRCGFTTVVASHTVSQLPKYVPRGQTAVADAYLTPGLRRYIDRVDAGLSGAPLYFMQSHGGLARADSFYGRDAILPAGGVVGTAHAGEAAGRTHLIGLIWVAPRPMFAMWRAR